MLLRPKQSEFRSRLDRIYGFKCCVSGCTVPGALEVAHIEPYADAHSNLPSNGLLLRRDLHALFDMGHLAIEPKSRKIFFSAEARGWTEYDVLHGQAVLASPQPGREKDRPDLAALGKRWDRFKKNHNRKQ